MSNLNDIGLKTQTDKASGSHGYLDQYERIANLSELRNKDMKMLEIGVLNGASIRMWAEYFEKGKIFGMDNLEVDVHLGSDWKREQNAVLYSDMMKENDRISIHQYDQGNREHLQTFIEEVGSDFDFIIDDGSHFQEDQMVSFAFLFQHLKSGGYYIIEDVALPLSRYVEEFNPDDRCWGIEKQNRQTGFFKDIVFNTFIDFAASRNIKSSYLTDDEIDYINKNVADSEEFSGLDIQLICLSADSTFITIKKK